MQASRALQCFFISACLLLVQATNSQLSQAASGQSAKAEKLWPFDALTGYSDPSEVPADLPLPSWRQNQDKGTRMIESPLDGGAMAEEVRTVHKKPTGHRAMLGAMSSHVSQQQRFGSDMIPVPGDKALPPAFHAVDTKAQQQQAKQVWDEYDVIPDADAPEAGVPRDDGLSSTAAGESLTREEQRHVGNVKRIPHTPRKTAPYLSRHRMAATQHQAHTSAAHEVQRQTSDTERMKGQCLSYAQWLKSQGVQGVALVRMWKGTCDGAVTSGEATPQYSTMCNALGGAVSSFAFKPGWTPDEACTAVIGVFSQSGIGSTPLA